MKMNDREIKAVIFDLDGTLLASNNVWSDVDREFFAMHQMDVPKDYNIKIAHMGLKECAVFTKKEYGIEESVEEICKTWTQMAAHKYANQIMTKPNAKEYLSYLKENNVKMAVATANSEALYKPCLERLQIMDFFDIVADVEKVNADKKSSKIYDFIADYFRLPHENIAVIEDMALCLKTAYEADYYTIAIYDEKAKNEEEKRKYSYRYIKDFKELL